jgi:diguanylate cyclase (GGDEF)-like protein
MPSILYSGRQHSDFYRQMWHQLTESGHWEGEIWNRRKNGEIYLEWLSIAAVTDDSGNISHYVGIFSDITRAKDNEQQLRRLAHFDQLTQLPNRILFHDRLHHAMAMARREDKQIAVLFLDLDGFKAINDSLGHAAGDELLRQVAARLQENLRESDTVSRFGGDEFTIVLPDVSDREGVAITAAKLIEAVARPYLINGHSAHVTTSLGISLYPTMADTSEKLITQSDIAMYHAKNHGKNHYEFFKPDFEGEV